MSLTRRLFLRSGLAAAGGWLAAPGTPAAASPSPEDPYTSMSADDADLHQRLAIINADDLGMSEEIDRGIFEAFDRGIVTSASLLVDGAHAVEAVRQVKRRSDVSMGLHVAFDDRERWLVNMQDSRAVQRELDRQLEAFVRLTGGPPSHIDSHHHAHMRFNVAWQFLEAGARYHCPVRGFTEVFFVGRFWGQPEFGRTDVTKISADYLLSILKSLGPGVSEISCHPGRMEGRPDARYNREREVELQSLCDARVKAAIAAEGIRLISFREYGHVASAAARRMLAGGCRPIASR
jgi:chitin disaccharide deacetylase